MNYIVRVSAFVLLGIAGSSAPAAPAAVFVGIDAATQGDWFTQYGADGYDVLLSDRNLPSYATMSIGSAGYHSFWAMTTNEARALQKPHAADRIAACAFNNTPSPMIFDINLTDAQTHQVAFYCLDWDGSNGRTQQLEVYDFGNPTPIDTRVIGAFSGGVYVVWNLTGHVIIRVFPLAGNAVVSGIFFGGPRPFSPPAPPGSLRASVAALMPGPLSPSQANVLLGFLDGAQLRVSQNNYPAAVSLLRSFVSYVNKYVSSGLLTGAQGTALTNPATAQIATLQGPGGAQTQGLRGNWRLEEASGLSAIDSSGTGNTGTLANGATRIPGQIGRAVSFNGLGQHVNCGSSNTLRMNTGLTTSAWIRPAGPGSGGGFGGIIVNKEGEYEIARFSNGQIQFAIANADPGWAWIPTGIIAPVGVWTHLAWTYSSSIGMIRFYLNGLPVFYYPGSGLIGDVDGFNEFRIGGRQNGTQDFDGAIDEVRAYDRAVSLEEAAALGFAP